MSQPGTRRVYRQVRARQEVYAGVQDFLLYVSLSERRMAGLITHSATVSAIALFTTLQRVQAAPHGRIWTDRSGKTVAI